MMPVILTGQQLGDVILLQADLGRSRPWIIMYFGRLNFNLKRSVLCSPASQNVAHKLRGGLAWSFAI
jgi:hypothetical protein